MDYHSMKRRELQALCKKHNIPANSANSVLADKLSELLNEKQKPNAQQRTVIKTSVETTDEGEPAVSKRQAKKVRFSPNNDFVEYEPGKKQMDMVTNTKGQRRSVSKKVDKSVIDDSNAVELIENGAQTSVKLTRSRVQGKQAVKDVEKGTDVVKGTEGNVGKVTRSKLHTFAEGGVDENKPRKRAVKDTENAIESVDETVIDRVRVTRSKAGAKRSDKQIAKGVQTVQQSEGTDVVNGTEGNLGKVTRSKVHTLAGDGVDENKPRKRAVKDVVDASESAVETVIDRVTVTRSKAETKRSGKQVAKDVLTFQQSEGTGVVKGTDGNLGKVTRSKVHTLAKGGVDENKPRNRAVKDVEDASESVDETVMDRVRVTRSKAETKRSGKQVAKDVRTEQSEEIINIPARVTRSRVQTSNEDVRNTVNDPSYGKKRTRREMKLTDTSKNSSNLAPEDNQKFPKRESARTRGVKNMNEDEIDKAEVVNESRVTRLKSPLAKKSSGRNNKSKIENKVEEPLKHAGKNNVTRRKSIVQVEKAESVLHLEEPAKRQTRKSVVKEPSKEQSDEVEENVMKSRKDAFENEKKADSNASGSLKSRKRRGNVVSEDQTVKAEFVSPVDESSNRSVHSVSKSKGKLVAGKQLESSLKTPASRKNAVTRDNSSTKRLKLSETKQSDSMESSLKTPASRKLVTPAIDESRRRFTRSAIRSERKEPRELAIEEQSRLSSYEIANIRTDPVFSTAPGRITRSGIKVGRNSASNFAERTDKNKRASRSAHQRERFDDDALISSPEVAEIGSNPDVTVAPSEISLNPDVTTDTRSEIVPNPVVPIEVQFEIRLNPDVTVEFQSNNRLNPDLPVESQFDIRSNPDLVVESQFEFTPNADVTIESESDIRPNPDATVESQSEIKPNPDVNVESQSKIRSSSDVTLESQSESRQESRPEIWPSPDVPVESQPEIRPSPDATLESQFEIRPNPDVTVESRSEVGPNPDDMIESQSERRPNPDVTVESQSEVGPNPEDTIESQSELRLNPDVTVESRSELRPNSDVAVSEIRPLPDGPVECQYDIMLNPDITAESQSEIRPNPDVAIGSQSEIRPHPDVTTKSQSEIRPNLDVSTGIQSEIKPNPEVPLEIQSEIFEENTVQILEKSADLSALEWSPTEDIEENRDSVTASAVLMETISRLSGQNPDSHDISNGSFARAKDFGGTPSGVSISNIKRTPFLMAEHAETVADVISDGSTMQNQNVDVKSSLFGEAEVQADVNVQKSVLISGRPEADENVSVDNALKDEEIKRGSVSDDVGSSDAFYLSFEQSDVKRKTKEVEVPDENDINEGIHELPGLGKSDGEDDVLDFRKENIKEHESEVLQSTGDDVIKMPVSGKSDGEDDECETEVSTPRIVLEDPALSGGVSIHEVDSVVGEYDAELKNYDSPNQSAGDDKFFQGLAIDECDTKYDKGSNLKPVGGDNVEEAHVVPDQHESMPVLTEFLVKSDLSTSKEAPQNPATSGNDGAEITCVAREEFILDINKDADISDGLENTTKFTDTKNYSGHQEKITGLHSNESGSVSLNVNHASSDKEEQKVATVDLDWDSGNFIEDDSNVGVDHENQTREEYSPKEDDITKQEENQNTSMYVDWGDYSFQVDEYQKPVSANESDGALAESEKDDRVSDIHSVKNVNEDSRNVADEKSHQDEDLLKGNANADMSEVIFNWPDSSLKSLFTPAGSRTRHLKHGQDDAVNFASQDRFADSSLKTLFATPATTQISHLKDVEEDAVSFAFSEDGCNERRKITPTLELNNNQLEMGSSKDYNLAESSLKTLFATPATTQISHQKDTEAAAVSFAFSEDGCNDRRNRTPTLELNNNQLEMESSKDYNFAESSLKTLFATPATTQISHQKDTEAAAVSFAFSEDGCNDRRNRTPTLELNNNQLEMESSKDYNRENEMYRDANFEDYSRKYFEDEEAGGSSEMSAKKKPFELEDDNNKADEFKQYDVSSEAAGTSHDSKDNTTHSADFERGM